MITNFGSTADFFGVFMLLALIYVLGYQLIKYR